LLGYRNDYHTIDLEVFLEWLVVASQLTRACQSPHSLSGPGYRDMAISITCHLDYLSGCRYATRNGSRLPLPRSYVSLERHPRACYVSLGLLLLPRTSQRVLRLPRSYVSLGRQPSAWHCQDKETISCDEEWLEVVPANTPEPRLLVRI
jgi:hypothetical protein